MEIVDRIYVKIGSPELLVRDMQQMCIYIYIYMYVCV